MTWTAKLSELPKLDLLFFFFLPHQAIPAVVFRPIIAFILKQISRIHFVCITILSVLFTDPVNVESL